MKKIRPRKNCALDILEHCKALRDLGHDYNIQALFEDSSYEYWLFDASLHLKAIEAAAQEVAGQLKLAIK